MNNQPIIKLLNLSKSFGDFKAVDGLSLEVIAGDVFGFLGPNGAGKSTTIRMMLSLMKPTAGSIVIFSKNLIEYRNEILSRIGCIIEKPDFYLYLSARKNLDLFGRLSGMIPTHKKTDALIEMVGLKGRENDLVRTYSHGMKQRLGIAQTLMHDPELIILDEPTTGLDPQGIIDVRNLILRLKNELGKTVVLSSHQLSEVEQIATRMAIIDKGKTMVQGEVRELLSSSDLIVSVEVADKEHALKQLDASAWKLKIKEQVNQHLDFHISKKEIPALNLFFTEHSIEVFSINYRRTLEDYFLKITNANARNKQ